MAHLYSSVKSRNCRESLSLVTDAIALKIHDNELQTSRLLSYVSDLNAWDRRKIDEPDYDRRHNAYINLNQVLVPDFA